ncbi:MAG: hypothetical protein IJ345_06265 [Clostridia bacterium]|nr:hypothetical protein [Clostridia bacterium]
MKKITVSVSFDDEKLSALKMYLEQRGQSVESELEKSIDTLYAKTVPAGVREFLDLRSGIPTKTPEKKKKPVPSAVADSAPDGSDGV